MPDYQGIGLGTKFLTFIAELYSKQGYDFSIVTSAKNLINALRKSDKWYLIRYNRPKNQHDKLRILRQVVTASFIFKKH